MEKKANIVKKGTPASKKTKEKEPYLTKRILISAARRGFKEAAEETMAVMGYNIIAKDGWIVKKFPDGRIEKLSKIA